MYSFVYEGVTITLKQPTGRDRIRLEQMRNMVDGYWSKTPFERNEIEYVLQLLCITDHVEGDLGFPVPCNGNLSPDTLNACIVGVWDAPEKLYRDWSTAWFNVMNPSGDPDLAQADTMTEKNSKTLASKKNEKP